MSITCFTGVSEPYIDPVFSITRRYQLCDHPKKVNLGVGAYRDHDGKSYVLNVVKKAEMALANDSSQSKDYLNIDGLGTFVNGTLKLLYGKDCSDISAGLIDGVQSISGTGACRLAYELLTKYHGVTTFYLPDPTWPIHLSMLEIMGITDIRFYRYYDKSKSQIAWNDVVSTLKLAPPRSAVVLHGCGHNPTGYDFTHEQWKTIADILIERELIPIIDIAYLGFVTGSIEKDAFSARLLHSRGKEMLVCISYAKNIGLYNERIGALCWFALSKNVSSMIKDRLCVTIRNMYSNPPAHGAKVVSMILNDNKLFEEWKTELKTMSDRISSMRVGLLERLQKLQTPGDWSFITKQQGLFSYTGMSKEQVKFLEDQFKIYMLPSGRINVSALTLHNIDYVADAIHQTATETQKA